jgi:hypothetical protein
MKERVGEALKTAEMNRWVREAGLRRQKGLSRTGYWLLCQLGRLLESWGQRLQDRYQWPPFGLEEQGT